MKLNTLHWGNGTGPRVLLIHGVQSAAATWWEIAEGLDASVTAPDLRGHGASPRAERYRLEDFVSDLEPGWDLVVGHSLGGTLAAYALQENPDFADRAVLLDPVFELPEDGFEAIVAGQLAELSITESELRATHPDWHAEHIRRKVQAARACDPYAAEATLRDNYPWDYAHLLDGLDVLVMGGDPAHGAMFDPRLAPKRYRMLEGAGHSVHRDRPDAILEALCR